MPLVKGGHHERGGKRGAPLKRRYSTTIGLSNVKMVVWTLLVQGGLRTRVPERATPLKMVIYLLLACLA